MFLKKINTLSVIKLKLQSTVDLKKHFLPSSMSRKGVRYNLSYTIPHSIPIFFISKIGKFPKRQVQY